MSYLMRLNPQTAAELSARRRALAAGPTPAVPLPLPPGAVAVHVRHGDKVRARSPGRQGRVLSLRMGGSDATFACTRPQAPIRLICNTRFVFPPLARVPYVPTAHDAATYGCAKPEF